MELEEILLSPFTTPSTCFSSSPCAGINRRLPFRFATENHVLGLSSPCNSSNNKPYRTVTHGTVPRDKPSVICVGFAQYPQTPSSASVNLDEPIQALALIDPLCIDQPEDAPPPLRQPQTATTGAPDTTARDDVSVVSVQDGSTVASSSRASSRRPSFNSGSVATTAASTRSKSDGTSMLDMSIRSLPNGGSGESSSIPIMEAITTTSLQQPPKARLILHVPPTTTSVDDENSMTTSTSAQVYAALCDFRPLSPCIAQWGGGGGSDAATTPLTVGIFVGSADDSQLRFYEPTNPLDGGHLVARADLPEEHFAIDTPVMGIDFHSNGETHTLATVGQDGTIQIISWNGNERSFQDISSHRVIVDGPLVSLQIQEEADNGGLRIIIGSLCGYVCHLTRAASAPASEWQGPTMVLQGLWNTVLQDEDSVLAVHAFGDCIALGTLGGRCLIYQAALFGQKYYKLWECTLPYSIHGLEVRMTTTDDDDSFDLIVLTRRSIHVFRPKAAVPISLPRAKYSIQAAKDRIRSLLQEHEPETPLENENTASIEKEDEKEESKTEIQSQDAVDPEATMNSAGNYILETPPTLEEAKDQEHSREAMVDRDQPSEVPRPSQELQTRIEENSDMVLQETVSAANSDVDGQDDEQWILIDAKEDTLDDIDDSKA
jgi:hypothetical protein